MQLINMTYVDISMLIVQGAMQTGQHSEGGGGGCRGNQD